MRFCRKIAKSVPKSVSRKERSGRSLHVFRAKSVKDALWVFVFAEIIIFFTDALPFFLRKNANFSEKICEKPSFSTKNAEICRNSEFFRDFRSFPAKKSVPAMQRASRGASGERPTTQRASHVKSVFSELISSSGKYLDAPTDALYRR